MAATALRSFFLTGPAIVFRWVQRATQTKLKRNSDSFFVYALNSFPGQIVTIFTRDDLGEVRENKGGGLFRVGDFAGGVVEISMLHLEIFPPPVGSEPKTRAGALRQAEARPGAQHGTPGDLAKPAGLDRISCLASRQMRRLPQDRLQDRVPTRCSGLLIVGYLLAPKLDAALLGSPQTGAGALADQAAFLFCEGCVDVQRERVNAAAEGADNKRNPLRHQAGNERHIARQPIKLRNSHLAFGLLRGFQCCFQFRPAIERIRALTGLDLGKLGNYLETFSLGELADRIALRFQAEARPALFLCRHAIVGNQRRHPEPLLCANQTEACVAQGGSKRNSAVLRRADYRRTCEVGIGDSTFSGCTRQRPKTRPRTATDA